MSETGKKEESKNPELTIDLGGKSYVIRKKDNMTTVIKADKTTGTEQVISRCWGLGDLDNYEFDPTTETLRSKHRLKNK